MMFILQFHYVYFLYGKITNHTLTGIKRIKSDSIDRGGNKHDWPMVEFCKSSEQGK